MKKLDMMLNELLEPSPGKMVRDLLEDFEIVGTRHEIVLKKDISSSNPLQKISMLLSWHLHFIYPALIMQRESTANKYSMMKMNRTIVPA